MFRLGISKPSILNGIVYYEEIIQNDDTGDRVTITRVVDDKNQPGDSLSRRRLHMMAQGVLLKKISRAVFFLADLIKIATANTWFIDASGTVFNYKKTKAYPLIFRKVTKVIPIKTGGVVIEVEGISNRFKAMYAPTENERYAGILIYEKASPLFYGFFDKQYDKTRRNL